VFGHFRLVVISAVFATVVVAVAFGSTAVVVAVGGAVEGDEFAQDADEVAELDLEGWVGNVGEGWTRVQKERDVLMVRDAGLHAVLISVTREVAT
jgi:hypothetical protein